MRAQNALQSAAAKTRRVPARQQEVIPATVGEEWIRRVEAEYRSAALTQHLTLWLFQIGASPDLIRQGLRIAEDELTHAELSHRVASAAGAKMHALDRADLGLVRKEPSLERDIARVCVQVFCLGETLAVRLFHALRKSCTHTAARAALDRILRDEVRHRDFGWALLGWLLELAPSLGQWIERELPDMLAEQRASYQIDSPTVATPVERSWGLMSPSEYGEILESSYIRDHMPRFGELGITWPLAEQPPHPTPRRAARPTPPPGSRRRDRSA